MPVRNTKTYTAFSAPNVTTPPVVPQNPQRVALYIQNTGGGAGFARLGGPCQLNGSDISLAAGASIKWDQDNTTPQEAVNVASSAATTWCIMETVSPQVRGGNAS